MQKLLVFTTLWMSIGYLTLAAENNQLSKSKTYSKEYQKWIENHKDSGLFEDYTSKPLSETSLYLHLDKPMRTLFKNFSSEVKQEVLEVINQSKTQNYSEIIEKYHNKESQKVEKDQEKMLQNGMYRSQLK